MLKYRTARDVFDAVADDFRVYDDQNLIDYATLIKVIKKCNADLSLSINSEAEVLIEVHNFSAKLPDNFEALDLAIACEKQIVDVTPAKGFQIEYHGSLKTNGCNVCLEPCGPDFKVIQKCDREYVQFDTLDVVRVVNTSLKRLSNNCANLKSRSKNEVKIDGDYMITNFETGYIYLRYITTMSDSEGRLLTLDHDLVNDFYEWACKLKILQNLHFNNDDDVERKIAMAKLEFRSARNQALGVVNTPEYMEVVNTLVENRRKFYRRYERPFYDTY